VTRRIRRRGEHVISRKAIAQGMPDCSACTCMLVCVFYVQFAHEIAGAACTRCSLRPLFSRAISCITRAHRAARRCGVMSVMPSYSKIMLALGYFEIVFIGHRVVSFCCQNRTQGTAANRPLFEHYFGAGDHCRRQLAANHPARVLPTLIQNGHSVPGSNQG
jgi:hypothetical protein